MQRRSTNENDAAYGQSRRRVMSGPGGLIAHGQQATGALKPPARGCRTWLYSSGSVAAAICDLLELANSVDFSPQT